jgi:hypothetical protein
VKMTSHVNPMQSLFKRGNYTYTTPYFFTELCLIENRTKFTFSLLCNWEHTATRSAKKTRYIARFTKVFLKSNTSCSFRNVVNCVIIWNKSCYMTQHKNLKWA